MVTQTSTKHKKALFLAKFASTLGNISEACTAAGISRSTYYNWIGGGASPALDKAFVQALQDTEETRTDFVESVQMKCIQGYTVPETRVFMVDETRTEIVKGKAVVVQTKKAVKVDVLKYIGADAVLVKHYLQAKARTRQYGKEVTVKHKGLTALKAILIKEVAPPADTKPQALP